MALLGPGFDRLLSLVLRFINTITFAARDFWPRRGASDAHTLQRSIRREQRRLGQKEPPPEGLRRIYETEYLARNDSSTLRNPCTSHVCLLRFAFTHTRIVRLFVAEP